MKSLLTIFAVIVPAFAQEGPGELLVKHWKTSGAFTLAVAKAMPGESYDFRPTPEEMTFGQLMAHIGGANLGACANASGLPKPEFPPKIAAYAKDTKLSVDRETVISFLTDSFDFCNKAVAAMTLDRMHAVVGPPARNLTAFEWQWSYFTHTAHHRGQAEVYLRLKGIKPPDYKF